MENLSIETINKILNNLPEDHRKVVAGILKGKITKRIICLSKSCKGRIVGFIEENGIVRTLPSEGKIWLRASRHRLDGFMGFQCWCGNDSRLAAQEKGNVGIEMNTVTKEDLAEVFDKVTKFPSNYVTINGQQIVDNFCIEDV